MAETEFAAGKLLKRVTGGPRGLLPSYVLYRLSKGQMSGYDLMSDLNSLTGGSWHPGSGSIYPILKELEKQGLIKVASKGTRSKQVYTISQKGTSVLGELQDVLNASAARWHKVREVYMDMLTPMTLWELLNETFRASRSSWEKVVSDERLSRDDRRFRLKEYRLLLESELHWVDKSLKSLQ